MPSDTLISSAGDAWIGLSCCNVVLGNKAPLLALLLVSVRLYIQTAIAGDAAAEAAWKKRKKKKSVARYDIVDVRQDCTSRTKPDLPLAIFETRTGEQRGRQGEGGVLLPWTPFFMRI